MRNVFSFLYFFFVFFHFFFSLVSGVLILIQDPTQYIKHLNITRSQRIHTLTYDTIYVYTQEGKLGIFQA